MAAGRHAAVQRHRASAAVALESSTTLTWRCMPCWMSADMPAGQSREGPDTAWFQAKSAWGGMVASGGYRRPAAGGQPQAQRLCSRSPPLKAHDTPSATPLATGPGWHTAGCTGQAWRHTGSSQLTAHDADRVGQGAAALGREGHGFWVKGVVGDLRWLTSQCRARCWVGQQMRSSPRESHRTVHAVQC